MPSRRVAPASNQPALAVSEAFTPQTSLDYKPAEATVASRSWVVIEFDSADRAFTGARRSKRPSEPAHTPNALVSVVPTELRHSLTSVPSSVCSTGQTMPSGSDNSDVVVRTSWFVLSAFARSATGKIDQQMEDKFAANKYKHFIRAFLQISILMPIGVVGQAISAATEGQWIRAGLLTLVAPLYLGYVIFVTRREKWYLRMSGTALEKGLVLALCFQSLTIIAAEFMRPRLDYGMLVMHIGFVHNFSPLSESSIHLVSTGCGLLPYILLKVVRFLEPTTSIAMSAPLQPDHRGCKKNAGWVTELLEILMPTVILLYQSIVTMGRFSSMRLDFLSGEQLRAQRRELNSEQKKVDGLLTSMLPRSIIKSLKANEPIDPQLYPDVTVIFIQICDFHRLCMHFFSQPEVVVEVLNILYLEFDRVSDLLHVYKVETVGDVYMAVVGCPEAITNHADVAAHFALAIQESMVHLRAQIATLKVEVLQTPKLAASMEVEKLKSEVITLRQVVEQSMINVRIGLNSGRLRAGVVGLECPRYKLVGDTVNTASRMESTCLPGRIQVSASTRDKLTPGMFVLEDRGEVQVKGKGIMRTAFLNGYADGQAAAERTVMIEHGVVSGSRQFDEDTLVGMRALDSDLNFWDTPGMCVSEVNNNRVSMISKGSHRMSPLASAMGPSYKPRWRQDFSRYGVLDHARPDDLHANTRQASTIEDSVPTWRTWRTCPSWDAMSRIFLLVPASQKQPEWLETLKMDRELFLEETLQKRISSARNLTIIWLLILAAVSVGDLFLDVLVEDTGTYRVAILCRAIGNNIVGLAYLLFVTSQNLFRKYAQRVTLLMLAAQGVALLACGNIIYNSDPAVAAMYGAYVLFYKVCHVWHRLTLCVFAVIGYVVGEIVQCGVLDGEAWRNVAFVLIFFFFVACGVRLEEHLEHVAHFEQRRVSQRLNEIKEAKVAGTRLLESLLPPHVVDLVAEGVSPIAEHHSQVTILFTDIKGFTAFSSQITPQETVDLLNSMYSAFDEIIVNWNLYKVEIIGDAYFVSAGCPAPQRQEDGKEVHMRPDLWAMRAVEVGLALQRALPTVCDRGNLAMRVGIHTGSVVAGVVGKKGPRYHLFGAAVGYAEKMESYGIPGRVHISSATHALLEQFGHDYDFEERELELAGEEGVHTTFLVNKSNNKKALQIQKEILLHRRHSSGSRMLT